MSALIVSGEIPSFKLTDAPNSKRLIRVADLEAWLARKVSEAQHTEVA